MPVRGWTAFTLVIASITALSAISSASPAMAAPTGCYAGPPTTGSSLSGVSATSPTNAWAVGKHFNGTAYQTLVEHWNGSAWAKVVSPNPAGPSNAAAFFSVATTSSSNAWAVGTYCNGSAFQALVAHWDGTAWNRVASPSPGSYPTLYAVAATSATNAWAVGSYSGKSSSKTLIEHWDGTAWDQVASPSPDASPRGGPLLYGVAATSANNAWSVGTYYNPTLKMTLTLVLHWDGKSWKQVASPNPGTVGEDSLYGVAATSATNAWAVGYYYNNRAYQTLVLHWNGTVWSEVASPNPGGPDRGNSLAGVAATSPDDAWATGIYVNSASGGQTLLLHWDGTAWRQVASPTAGPPFPGDVLTGVAATSPVNAWTVGGYCASKTCPARNTLTERWNGTSWTHVASP